MESFEKKPNLVFYSAQANINYMVNEMRMIEAVTCIRFVVRTVEIDFLEIINGSGCWSWLGRRGGRQELSMRSPGCMWEGTMVHEAIHALGYDHMHNSADRDNFVRILWENIPQANQHNFNTVNPNLMHNFNTPYDLRSVMHYWRNAFGISGRDTIVPHNNAYLNIIGQDRMSSGDVTRLNRMYECIL